MTESTAMTAQQRALYPLVTHHLVDAWPAVGEAVGVRSKSAALRAIDQLEAAGQLTALRVGHRVRVPSAALLRLLGLTRGEALDIVYPEGTPAAAQDPRDDAADDVAVDGAK